MLFGLVVGCLCTRATLMAVREEGEVVSLAVELAQKEQKVQHRPFNSLACARGISQPFAYARQSRHVSTPPRLLLCECRLTKRMRVLQHACCDNRCLGAQDQLLSNLIGEAM